MCQEVWKIANIFQDSYGWNFVIIVFMVNDIDLNQSNIGTFIIFFKLVENPFKKCFFFPFSSNKCILNS
jgi:hypothetical protein